MKTYYLILSKTYPDGHPKKGQPTYFCDKVFNALHIQQHKRKPNEAVEGIKIHTIRANYPLWRKRFEEIARGEACLSVRTWTGTPFRSSQAEICSLTKDDKIGIQQLVYNPIRFNGQTIMSFDVDGKKHFAPETLSYNDGLSCADWKAWFSKENLKEPLAIIHFTPYRY